MVLTAWATGRKRCLAPLRTALTVAWGSLASRVRRKVRSTMLSTAGPKPAEGICKRIRDDVQPFAGVRRTFFGAEQET
jgi:hypothetical protein